MRRIGLGTLLLAALALLPMLGSAAHADPYRWCAVYGGRTDGTTTNCGFVTHRQCMDTISGIGGWCEPNQFYDGRSYDGSEYRPRRHRRHYRYYYR
jgi:Protein of unknown function (DUF3551)